MLHFFIRPWIDDLHSSVFTGILPILRYWRSFGLRHYPLSCNPFRSCEMSSSGNFYIFILDPFISFVFQVNPNLYTSIFNGWSTIFKQNGVRGLYTGGVPTLFGYSMQGAFKYGFYEYFKKLYADMAGEEVAYKYRTSLYLAASASAEVFADIALCPMEALKVRSQTSTTPFATSTLSGIGKIMSNEGISGFYKGLVPLWGRQIPYTMMKFASFERTVEAIYKYCLSKPKHEYNKAEQLGVTFVAGYWAGILCAVVSHPADTVVSKLNNMSKSGEGGGIMRIIQDVGFRGLWTGLGTRIVMVGTLTALQWFVYDTFKVYIGLPTSGASKPKTE